MARTQWAANHEALQQNELERLRSEDTPPPPHYYPCYWVKLDPKSKEDKVKVTNLKNSPKFKILKQALHATHLLKLLDKMCKYEMDPTSIIEDTERTRFCPQTNRRTDRQMDKVKPVYSPFNFVEAGGITSKYQWQTTAGPLKIKMPSYQQRQERRYMPKYPQLPRSVYMQRVEIVKQSGLWSGLGR